MTVDEDRLADWLRRTTPEPPRAVRVEDVGERLDLGRPNRLWAPLLAAACVLALAIGVSVGLREHGSDHVTNRPYLQVHPWHARALSRVALKSGAPNSLIGHGSSLYGLSSDGADLLRLDPVTGAVTSRATSVIPISGPVYAAGRIWVVSRLSPDIVLLRAYDLSLSASVERTIPVVKYPDSTANVEIAATADGRSLYLSTGRQIISLDPESDGTRSRIDYPTRIDEFAVSPNGRTIFVLGRDRTTVDAIDATTQRTVGVYSGFGTASALVATDEGFFIRARLRERTFEVARFVQSMAKQVRPHAHSPFSPLTHVSGGVAWSGGGDDLVCADPADGSVRARVALGPRTSIYPIDLNGQLYGIYRREGTDGATTRALIQLTPPKICGLG